MATPGAGEKAITKKFESFTEKFKPQSVINMTDLRMTSAEGFALKDLNDMENCHNILLSVKNVFVTDNLISKLTLRNFNSFEIFDGSKNMISDVNLRLQNLKILNLSYNLLTVIFDLSGLPKLEILVLSYNMIEKVTVKDLSPVKSNLIHLDLSFNKINFEAYDFISFFEGLKTFKIKNFDIKENSFIEKNPALKNIYKIYISLSMPTLEYINSEKNKIDPSITNLSDLTNQIILDSGNLQKIQTTKKLEDENKLYEKLENEKNKINKEVKKFDYDEINQELANKEGNKESKKSIKEIFIKIIEKLDDIYMSTHNFQMLYMEVLDYIKLLISNNYEKDEDFLELKSLFATLLQKFYCFIENSDEKEESTIFRMIANLSFIENGYFSKMCFDFFTSLMISSQNRVEHIGLIVKIVINEKLSEILKWKDISILKNITEFFDDKFNIDMDSIFKNNIQNFLKLTERIWNKKEIVNHVQNDEDNDDIINTDLVEDIKLEYELKITCIKLLKKYFEILIKSGKELSFKEIEIKNDRNSSSLVMEKTLREINDQENNEENNILNSQEKEEVENFSNNKINKTSSQKILDDPNLSKISIKSNRNLNKNDSVNISKHSDLNFNESFKNGVKNKNEISTHKSLLESKIEDDNLSYTVDNDNLNKSEIKKKKVVIIKTLKKKDGTIVRMTESEEKNFREKNDSVYLASSIHDQVNMHLNYSQKNFINKQFNIGGFPTSNESKIVLKSDLTAVDNFNNQSVDNPIKKTKKIIIRKIIKKKPAETPVLIKDNENQDLFYEDQIEPILNQSKKSAHMQENEISMHNQSKKSDKIQKLNSFQEDFSIHNPPSLKSNHMRNENSIHIQSKKEDEINSDYSSIIENMKYPETNNVKKTNLKYKNSNQEINFKNKDLIENNKNFQSDNEEEINFINKDNQYNQDVISRINISKHSRIQEDSNSDEEIKNKYSLTKKKTQIEEQQIIEYESEKSVESEFDNENNDETSNEKKLDLYNFMESLKTMNTFIRTKYPKISELKDDNDLELFVSYLDFVSLLFRNIENLIKLNLIDTKTSDFLQFKKSVKYEEIIEYLLLFVEPIIKKYKLEEDREENLLENKLETTFTEYFLNKTGNSKKKKLIFTDFSRIKELIMEIIKCVASCFRLNEEGQLQQNFEREIIKKIINITKKSSQIDPFMLEASCNFILILLGDPKIKSDYMIFFILVNKIENFVNFKNLLELINTEDKKYIGFIDFIYRKLNPEKKPLNLNYTIDQLDTNIKVHVIRVIKSIIFIFKKIAKFAIEGNSTIVKTAKEIGVLLRSNNQYSNLSNCLKILDDDLRLSAIKTLYYNNNEKIQVKIIEQITHIISKYNSITEGKTEDILSIFYLLLNKIVCTQLGNDKSTQKVYLMNALEKSFEFLGINLDRNPIGLEEITQKNDLSLSLILFITSTSKFNIFKVDNPRNIERFHTIINYDYKFFDRKIYIPVEIERTSIGSRIKNYIELTKMNPGINPYSFNFLRIVIKIADILCNIPDYSLPFNLDEKPKSILNHLGEYIKKRFLFRLYNESLNWSDFHENLDKCLKENSTIKEYVKEIKNKNKRLLIKDNEDDLNVYYFDNKIFKNTYDEIKSYERFVSDNPNKKKKKAYSKKYLEIEETLRKIQDQLFINVDPIDEEDLFEFNEGIEDSELSRNTKDFNISKNINNSKNSKILNQNKSKILYESKNKNNNKSNNYNNYNKNSPSEGITNYVMDYYVELYEKIDAEEDVRKSKLKNKKNSNIVKCNPYAKSENAKTFLLYEQIDFIVFFPNLLNFILGKSSNSASGKNKSELYLKYDKDILNSIQTFKQLKNVEDLQKFNLINKSNELNNESIKSHVKINFFDKTEKKFSNLLGKSIQEKAILNTDNFSELIKSVNSMKNAELIDNYKENFYCNTLNFNKKTFSKYFNSRNLLVVPWEYESPFKFHWKDIKYFERNDEAENLANCDLRSLLVSALLRSVYSLLKSSSKNITIKFMEIFFSNKIYQDFFLFASSGSYVKFNIGQKILNILILIFSKNFHYLIDYTKFIYSVGNPAKKNFNKKDVNTSTSKNTSNNTNTTSQNKNKTSTPSNNTKSTPTTESNSKKIEHENFNKQIKDGINVESPTEYNFKYFIKILEIFHIASITIRKIYSIYFINKNINFSCQHNLVNIFICSLNSILNALCNTNFPDDFKESIEILIINNLVQNNLIKNILPYCSILKHLDDKVSKILYKKLQLNNYYHILLDKKPTSIDDDIMNHFISFKFYLERNRKLFINTISAMKILCKENKNMFMKELISFDLSEFHSKLKFKFNLKNSTKEKKDLINIQYFKDINKTKEESKKIEKSFSKNISNHSKIFEQSKNLEILDDIYIERESNKTNNDDLSSNKLRKKLLSFNGNMIKSIFDESNLIDFTLEVQKLYLNDEIKISFAKCEMEYISDHRIILGVVIMTNFSLYFFELDEKEHQNGMKYKLKSKNSFVKFDLKNIKQLKYYDYYSRIIVKYEEEIEKKTDGMLGFLSLDVLSKEKENIEKENDKEKENEMDKENEKIKSLTANDIKIEDGLLNENKKDENETKSASKDKRLLYLCFSFSNIFNSIQFYNNINEFRFNFLNDDDKIKKTSVSSNSFVGYFIYKYEQNLKDSKKKGNSQENTSAPAKEQENEDEVPLELDEFFKQKEYEFYLNEYQISNNFSFNKINKDNLCVLLKNLRTFVINYKKDSLFGLGGDDNSYIITNKKVLYLGDDHIYILRENFKLFSENYFDDIYLYINHIERFKFFDIMFSIPYGKIKGFHVKDFKFVLQYVIDDIEKKEEFYLNESFEIEALYFYILRATLRANAQALKNKGGSDD